MGCFCGCGRDISGMRQRSQNTVAKDMAGHLETFEGASRVDGVDAQRAAAAIPQGQALVAVLRSVIHGERSRKDLDKRATRDWHMEAGKIANDLLDQASDIGFLGSASTLSALVYRGQRFPGVIAQVHDTGVEVNRSFRVRLAIDVQPDEGEPFRVERTMLVSRIAVPRVGDRVEVAIDRDDPDEFAFRIVPA